MARRRPTYRRRSGGRYRWCGPGRRISGRISTGRAAPIGSVPRSTALGGSPPGTSTSRTPPATPTPGRKRPPRHPSSTRTTSPRNAWPTCAWPIRWSRARSPPARGAPRSTPPTRSRYRASWTSWRRRPDAIRWNSASSCSARRGGSTMPDTVARCSTPGGWPACSGWWRRRPAGHGRCRRAGRVESRDTSPSGVMPRTSSRSRATRRAGSGWTESWLRLTVVRW